MYYYRFTILLFIFLMPIQMILAQEITFRGGGGMRGGERFDFNRGEERDDYYRPAERGAAWGVRRGFEAGQLKEQNAQYNYNPYQYYYPYPSYTPYQQQQQPYQQQSGGWQESTFSAPNE